jgi:hypothetical protein
LLEELCGRAKPSVKPNLSFFDIDISVVLSVSRHGSEARIRPQGVGSFQVSDIIAGGGTCSCKGADTSPGRKS